MIRVGIISDTHGVLAHEAITLLASADHIVHAGDIGEAAILDELAALAPLTAVAGNIDGFVCGDAREEARVILGGQQIYVTHILERPGRIRADVAARLRREPADIVIFGHSHLPHNETVGGILYFNPASAGPRRFGYPRSVGFIEIDGTDRRAWHVALDDRSNDALVRHMNQLSR
jgi:hypothetical protein